MADIVDAIEQMSACLESSLPAGFAIDQIEYPNHAFDNENNEKWIRCVWNNLGNTSTDASGCYVITEGILSIDIFYPKNSGDLLALRDAVHIKELFKTYVFLDVTILDAFETPVPEISDWFSARVEITYQYEGYIA